MIDLLNRIKAGRTWQQVGERLGGRYSGAFWRLIARGERHATLEQINIVRVACGLEPLAQSPAQAVEEAGIDRVVRCSKRPNTAILAAISGGVYHVTIRTGEPQAEVAATIPLTLSYSHAMQRGNRQGNSVPSMSDLAKMPVSAFRTIRGKTGNLAAIAAAAQRASEAFSTYVYEEV
jgi:hypothetical protein